MRERQWRPQHLLPRTLGTRALADSIAKIFAEEGRGCESAKYISRETMSLDRSCAYEKAIKYQ